MTGMSSSKGQPGWFYEKELSKVILDEREKHRIIRVIRRQTMHGRIQYLVSWLGYPSSFNSLE